MVQNIELKVELLMVQDTDLKVEQLSLQDVELEVEQMTMQDKKFKEEVLTRPCLSQGPVLEETAAQTEQRFGFRYCSRSRSSFKKFKQICTDGVCLLELMPASR
ncbi:hypothetical protein RRG08_005353 [Elysia crispata]|uniref:Uncharacterized protein n=1 Tax=Elysia crispata TaxID=231223 RepID=A0AAE1CPD1_9GAST|nr:hypothetical protein RRG08_005353 [Elysia crispata]